MGVIFRFSLTSLVCVFCLWFEHLVLVRNRPLHTDYIFLFTLVSVVSGWRVALTTLKPSCHYKTLPLRAHQCNKSLSRLTDSDVIIITITYYYLRLSLSLNTSLNQILVELNRAMQAMGRIAQWIIHINTIHVVLTELTGPYNIYISLKWKTIFNSVIHIHVLHINVSV